MRAKILIIDADKILAKIYSKKLESEFVEVKICATIEEAEKKLVKYNPNVIAIDVGRDITEEEEFVKDQIAKNVKILVIAESGEKEAVRKILLAGVTDYFIKAHATTDEVVKKIKSLCASVKSDKIT